MKKASNGYFLIEVIHKDGDEFVQCYIGDNKEGRLKKIYYDTDGPFFKKYNVKYYINEFIIVD